MLIEFKIVEVKAMHTIRFRTLLSTMSLLWILATLIVVPMVQTSPETYGPRLDELYGRFIESPDAQNDELSGGTMDIWFDIRDPVIIRNLEIDDYTVVGMERTFQFYYIAFNMRDQLNPSGGGDPWRTESAPSQYYTYSGAPYTNYVPLDHRAFRHACAHCIPKREIVAVVYGGKWGASAINSTVPRAHYPWWYPFVPGHSYNPGDPVTSPPTEHSACGILKQAGYVWEPTAPNPAPKHSPDDPDGNWLDPHLHADEDDPDTPWNDMLRMPMNHITFAGVTLDLAPNSWGRDDLCARDLRAIGLPIEHVAVAYSWLTDTMMGLHQFDMYAAGWKVGRFPDHLYGFFHSSQDMIDGYNFPGINDTILDLALGTFQFSMDPAVARTACWDAQIWIAERLPYIVTVARPAICASLTEAAGHGDTLKGIVNSPGYGQENDYTFCSLHWNSSIDNATNPYGIGGSVRYIVGSKPTNYHPGYASTTDEWMVIGRLFDGLVNVDAYTHHIIPWLATSWTIENWTAPGGIPGMNTTFWLRDDVYYHDGAEFNASVVEFSLKWVQDMKIGRAQPMWQNLVDVQVHNETMVSVYHNATSLWISNHTTGPDVWQVNDAACWATMFPPHIYEGTDQHFRPEETINPINPLLTCLVGTGSFVFREVDMVLGGYARLTAFRDDDGTGPGETPSPVGDYHWWMSVEEYADLVREQFHWIGDVNSDGIIDIDDLNKAGKAYGSDSGDPDYDEDVDTDPEPVYHENDDRCDMRDIAELAKNWGKQRDYP